MRQRNETIGSSRRNTRPTRSLTVVNSLSLLVSGCKTTNRLPTAPEPTRDYSGAHPTRKHPNCLISLVFRKPWHIKNSEKLKNKINFQKSPYRMNGMTWTESTYGWHVLRARAKRANDCSGYWPICKPCVSGKQYTIVFWTSPGFKIHVHWTCSNNTDKAYPAIKQGRF